MSGKSREWGIVCQGRNKGMKNFSQRRTGSGKESVQQGRTKEWELCYKKSREEQENGNCV